jgi:hypothetical protein
LLERLTSEQIAEWYEYFKLEPWGEREAWLRAGLITATIANVHRKKGSPPIKPEDVIRPEIQAPQEVKRQTMAEQKSALGRLVEHFRKAGRLIEKRRHD